MRIVMIGAGYVGLVENDDLTGVTNLLKAFISMPPVSLVEMGQKARKGFLKNFEISGVTDSMLSIFEELIKERDASFDVGSNRC